MNSLLPTIVPKSDQLNADDMIGGPMTIKVTKVSILGDADQPVAVHFEGDSGRPFKPCKSMRRVMVQIWGEDGNAFVGQRMTIYRDDRVTFGKDAVGGIRISHMSGIDREKTLALMVTRGQQKPYTVRPLQADRGEAPAFKLPVLLADGRLAAANGSASLSEWWSGLGKAEKAAAKETLDAELKTIATRADQAALDAPFDEDTGEILEQDLPGHDDEPEDEGFPGDRPSTDQRAEPAVLTWGRDFLAWIPSAQGKALTEAWAEAKREGKPAALQNLDADLFDAVIEAKDKRFDGLKAAASRAQG
jgi:hypothetical protein